MPLEVFESCSRGQTVFTFKATSILALKSTCVDSGNLFSLLSELKLDESP